MKKTFFLMLMLASTLVINAQSLTGKQWCTKIADEDGKDIALVLNFEKNGSCEVVMAAEQDMKEDGVPIEIYAGVNIPGTYTQDGKDLNLNLNKGKTTAEIDYDIKGMDAKTKSMMDKQIRSELNGMKEEFKKFMLNGMPNLDHMKIVSLDSKKLVVTLSVGAEVTFYAK